MLGDKGLIKYSSSFFLVKTRVFLVKCLHIVQNKCFHQSYTKNPMQIPKNKQNPRFPKWTSPRPHDTSIIEGVDRGVGISPLPPPYLPPPAPSSPFSLLERRAPRAQIFPPSLFSSPLPPPAPSSPSSLPLSSLLPPPLLPPPSPSSPPSRPLFSPLPLTLSAPS